MKLIEALDFKFPKIISLVGAGGKTSFIFTLAKEAAELGKSVLITTTTAMFTPDYSENLSPRPFQARGRARIFIGPARELQHLAAGPGAIWVAAQALRDGDRKLAGYPLRDLVQALTPSRFDLILIEADGAKMRPVKAPAAHEPVIPDPTDMVVGCIGLDCLGTPLAAPYVHRPEILADLSGQGLGTPVTKKTLTLLAKSERGLFKSVGPDMKKILVLNKADSPLAIDQGKALARDLISRGLADLCLITCFLTPDSPVIKPKFRIPG